MREIMVTAQKGAATKDLFGIFFEDINHAADGGLYGEMLQNRAFEYSPIDGGGLKPLTAWKIIDEGGAKVAAFVSDRESFSKKNPHYLVLDVEETGERAGIKNIGYNSGLCVKKGAKYVFSCIAKAEEKCDFDVSLESAGGKAYGQAKLVIDEPVWKKYSFELTSDHDDASATLSLTTGRKCKACFDLVSLFPRETYKGRENGLRKDLAVMLEELKPAFVRFPGGCLVHDGSLNKDDRNANYRWKNTVGPLTERASRRNNWGYNQSLGLGFYEYFLLCEDIGATPLPVIAAGYNPHMQMAVPLDEMQEWVDDALDLIEFANGDVTTTWGRKRIELGHPEPFGLRYLAIGNEEVGQAFWDRYDIIHKAVREKYPEIKLINSAGPFPAGGEFERGWANARKNGSDLVDEHYYTSPEWMLANIHRYDDMPDGPKVFLGEYGTWGNTFYNALVEAAYMTGLENNAAHVGLACYAPLFLNVDYHNWSPDLIWFDNHRVCGSVNYYVQKMFMHGRGDNLLLTKLSGTEKPVVVGDDCIFGEIMLFADNCKADFWDIEVTDIEKGETVRHEDVHLEYRKGVSLGNINSSRYRISFKARKSIGHNGFRLEFGKKDDGNLRSWNIGGWDNQDTEISGRINGRGTSLDQNIFSTMADVTYDLALEVDGRNIVSYIDGKIANKAIDRKTLIEDLYVSATEDASYIYMKVVNVKDNEAETKISVENCADGGNDVYVLTGDNDAKNTLDEPFMVVPLEKDIRVEHGMFTWKFAPRSVTMFRIKK